MKKSLFHVRLKELRTQNGLAQEKLAKILNTPRSTIASWEVGVNAPSVETLITLADHFDVSIDYLVGRKEYEE